MFKSSKTNTEDKSEAIMESVMISKPVGVTANYVK